MKRQKDREAVLAEIENSRNGTEGALVYRSSLRSCAGKDSTSGEYASAIQH